MIEDYYNILNLKPRNGQYKISIRYLKLSRKFLNSHSTKNNEVFYQLNRAFEVLRDPDIKKYYDILHNECSNNSLDPENQAIIKYIDIIRTHELAGNIRAEKLLNDPVFLEESKITQSWSKLLLNFILYINPSVAGLYFIPITGLIFIFLSIGVIITGDGFLNPNRLAPGICFFIVGFLIVFLNFRQFITDRMNK